MAVEILTIKTRNNPELRAIHINENNPESRQNHTTKIKQFADDTTLTMKNENDIKVDISTVEEFQEFSGLKLNRHKSEGIWMGSGKHKKGKIQDIPMKRVVKILGVFFSAENEASILEENWNTKSDNLTRSIKQWENRNPTLYGKVIPAKTLLLSQFSHILQVLALPQHILTRINTIVYRFLWKRKYNNKKSLRKLKEVCLVWTLRRAD